MRTTLLFLLTSSLAALAACAGDPEIDDQTPTDTGLGDGSGDAPECDPSVTPEHGGECDCEGGTFDDRVDDCDRSCVCEFGSWSCTDDCDEPPVFALTLSESPTVDEQTGNGDTEINPGETWSVTGTIVAANPPEGGADTTVRLVSDSIYVDADGASEMFQGLGTEPVAFTLEFDVSTSAPAATVTLTLEAYSGFTTDSVEIEIDLVPEQIPVLVFDDVEILNASGGPALRIQAGDTITIEATLANDGPVGGEGVSVTAVPTSAALSTPAAASVGTLAAGSDTTVSFELTVAEDPAVLDPVVTLTATATNADSATEDVDVAIYPPDTIVVTGHVFEAAGGANEWDLVVSVENQGRFDITGLTWTRLNYESLPVPVAMQDDYPDADCVDQIPPPSPPEGWEPPPCYVSMGVGEPSGPVTLAADASGEVTLPLTVTGETPAIGLVILRGSSALRSHGPFNLELDRP